VLIRRITERTSVCNKFDRISAKVMDMEPADLARWTRFAAKGGIGKCMAQCDWVAEESDELMFLKVCS
jgi:CelD/BcsL family acetyltransferase involved in cellulose biosynthesis